MVFCSVRGALGGPTAVSGALRSVYCRSPPPPRGPDSWLASLSCLDMVYYCVLSQEGGARGLVWREVSKGGTSKQDRLAEGRVPRDLDEGRILRRFRFLFLVFCAGRLGGQSRRLWAIDASLNWLFVVLVVAIFCLLIVSTFYRFVYYYTG